MKNDKPNIVILTPTIPFPDVFGNRKRIVGICSQLKEWSNLSCLVYPIEANQIQLAGQNGIFECSKFFDYFDIIWSDKKNPQTNPVGTEHLIDEWYSDKIHKEFNKLDNLIGVDALIVNYVFMSKIFEHIDPKIFKVIDMHDIFADRKSVLLNSKINAEFFYTTRTEELKALKRADLIWSITDDDRLVYANELNNISTLPTKINHSNVTFESNNINYTKGVLVGAQNNLNRIYFQKFIDCFTEINKGFAAPLNIHIFGDICSELVSTSQSIVLEGFEPNLSQIYNKASFSISPLEHGTGLKTKTVEALAFDIPLFCTTHSSIGIDSEFENHLFDNVEKLVQFLIIESFKPDWLNKYRNQGKQIIKKLDDRGINVIKEFKTKLKDLIFFSKKKILIFNQKEDFANYEFSSLEIPAWFTKRSLIIFSNGKESHFDNSIKATHNFLISNSVIVGLNNLVLCAKKIVETGYRPLNISLFIQNDVHITPYLINSKINIKVRQFEFLSDLNDFLFELESFNIIITSEPNNFDNTSPFVTTLNISDINFPTQINSILNSQF